METINDCCEDMRSLVTSRRALLLGGASFAAWAYLPKFARAADGRDPRLVVADAASTETRHTIERAESRPQALALLLMSPEFQRR